MLCIASLVATSATASAVTSATSSTAGATTAAPAKAKIKAELLDKKVKVNANARIRGELDLDAAGQRALEPIVVQRLSAGVWVDVLTTTCLPNFTFRLRVSFSIAANYSLRVYHPTTQVSSNVFVLAVLG
jgi:hypothetical protein